MYCYRFPDRDTFLTICELLGWMSETTEDLVESTLIKYTKDRSIDEVGSITITEATYDDDLNEITPPIVDDRHHVNFMGTHPVEFDDYLIQVNSPSRLFFGFNGPSLDPYTVINNSEEQELS